MKEWIKKVIKEWLNWLNMWRCGGGEVEHNRMTGASDTNSYHCLFVWAYGDQAIKSRGR